jgi:PKD repeat protein
MVEPRGGGGSGAVVLAVALLAGFLFIGGAAAIYLSNPPGSADRTDIAFASGSPTLPPFVQLTASPVPTETPTFILLPSDSPSFSPFPTSSIVGPTAPPTPVGPTSPPRTPAPTPGGPTPPPSAVTAKFTCSQQGTSLTINCQDNSTGPVESRQWNFGDGGTDTGTSPSHTYQSYGTKTVTLVVNGPNGATSFKQKQVVVAPPATPTPSAPPATASPPPSDQPTATPPDITPSPVASVAAASEEPSPDGSTAP